MLKLEDEAVDAHRVEAIKAEIEYFTDPQTILTINHLEEAQQFARVIIQRQKCNLAREFCDCIKMAELLRHYCSPTQQKYIKAHIFVSASSLSKKRANWDLLNRRVMTKLFNYEFPDWIIDGCTKA